MDHYNAPEISAEVEFFSQEDIDDFKYKHSVYLANLKEETDKKYQELLDKEFKRTSNSLIGKTVQKMQEKSLSLEKEKELRDKAATRAKRELKESSTAASYDQYERIQSISIDQAKLGGTEKIIVSSYVDLMQQLNNYVGASGKFMPLTKSVTLGIPEESLRGLQIIDTPGLNDPVQSRSERTEDFLSKCDTVFVISPAGQFLNEDDKNLMPRLAGKEGIKEIFLIASQADLQLYGQEYTQNSPSEIYTAIAETLAGMRNRVLLDTVSIPDEVGAKMRQHPILCTSSICYALSNVDNFEMLQDEDQKHTYNQLKNKFPSVSDISILRKELATLANIEVIQKLVKDVRARKAEILEKRRQDFRQTKEQQLEKYINAWIDQTKNEIHRIETADINDLRVQQKSLEQQQQKLKSEISDGYEECVEDYIDTMNKRLSEQWRNIRNKMDNAMDGVEEHRTETITKEEERGFSNLFGLLDRTYSKTNNFVVVNASKVKSVLSKCKIDLEDGFNNIVKEEKKLFKRRLAEQIQRKIPQLFPVGGTKKPFIAFHYSSKKLNKASKYKLLLYFTPRNLSSLITFNRVF